MSEMPALEFKDALQILTLIGAAFAAFFAVKVQATKAADGVTRLETNIASALNAVRLAAEEALRLGKAAHTRLDEYQREQQRLREAWARVDERDRIRSLTNTARFRMGSMDETVPDPGDSR